MEGGVTGGGSDGGGGDERDMGEKTHTGKTQRRQRRGVEDTGEKI